MLKTEPNSVLFYNDDVFLSKEVYHCMKTKLYCDVMLCHESTGPVDSIMAHRVLLASASPFLYSILKSHPDMDTHIIFDAPKQVLKELVQFLYGNQLTFDFNSSKDKALYIDILSWLKILQVDNYVQEFSWDCKVGSTKIDKTWHSASNHFENKISSLKKERRKDMVVQKTCAKKTFFEIESSKNIEKIPFCNEEQPNGMEWLETEGSQINDYSSCSKNIGGVSEDTREREISSSVPFFGPHNETYKKQRSLLKRTVAHVGANKRKLILLDSPVACRSSEHIAQSTLSQPRTFITPKDSNPSMPLFGDPKSIVCKICRVDLVNLKTLQEYSGHLQTHFQKINEFCEHLFSHRKLEDHINVLNFRCPGCEDFIVQESPTKKINLVQDHIRKCSWKIVSERQKISTIERNNMTRDHVISKTKEKNVSSIQAISNIEKSTSSEWNEKLTYWQNTELSQNNKIKSNRMFLCDKCGRTFKLNISLKKHKCNRLDLPEHENDGMDSTQTVNFNDNLTQLMKFEPAKVATKLCLYTSEMMVGERQECIFRKDFKTHCLIHNGFDKRRKKDNFRGKEIQKKTDLAVAPFYSSSMDDTCFDLHTDINTICKPMKFGNFRGSKRLVNPEWEMSRIDIGKKNTKYPSNMFKGVKKQERSNPTSTQMLPIVSSPTVHPCIDSPTRLHKGQLNENGKDADKSRVVVHDTSIAKSVLCSDNSSEYEENEGQRGKKNCKKREKKKERVKASITDKMKSIRMKEKNYEAKKIKLRLQKGKHLCYRLVQSSDDERKLK